MWWLLIVLLLLSRKSGTVSASVNVVQQPVAGAPPAQAPVIASSPAVIQNSSSPGFAAHGGITPDAGAVDVLVSQSANGSQIWRRPNGDTYQLWATDDPSVNAAVGAPPAS